MRGPLPARSLPTSGCRRESSTAALGLVPGPAWAAARARALPSAPTRTAHTGTRSRERRQQFVLRAGGQDGPHQVPVGFRQVPEHLGVSGFQELGEFQAQRSERDAGRNFHQRQAVAPAGFHQCVGNRVEVRLQAESQGGDPGCHQAPDVGVRLRRGRRPPRPPAAAPGAGEPPRCVPPSSGLLPARSAARRCAAASGTRLIAGVAPGQERQARRQDKLAVQQVRRGVTEFAGLHPAQRARHRCRHGAPPSPRRAEQPGNGPALPRPAAPGYHRSLVHCVSCRKHYRLFCTPLRCCSHP